MRKLNKWKIYLCYPKRGAIYQISDINAAKLPVLYTVVDLMKEKLPNFFYREQLTKTSKPDNDFFQVEKIIAEKNHYNLFAKIFIFTVINKIKSCIKLLGMSRDQKNLFFNYDFGHTKMSIFKGK